MASRVIVIMMMIFAISFISACVESACPQPAQYFLKDITTQAFDVNIINADQQERINTDTLVHQLAFETIAQIEFAAAEYDNNAPFRLMNTAYGCVDNELLNPINPNASSFSSNREIIIEGTTLGTPNNCVDPHTNLLQDERIKHWIEFPSHLSLETDAITRVDHSQLKLPEGDYTFYFKWETNDGVELSDSIQVYLSF